MFKNKYPGKFIAIEGLGGSGSSTQAEILKNYFIESNHQTLITHEPTNNVIGGLIRGCLTNDWKIASPLALQLLFAADRANHLEKDIVPALKNGQNVIADRYFLSSLAYGSVQIQDLEWLSNINSQFILPDLTILLKISAKTCLERSQTGPEERKLGLFNEEEEIQKVWQAYESLSKKYPNIVIIDGEKSVEEISKKIKQEVEKII